ncbi:hypothetical protein PAU_01952 [Photorhabdus asymbiotica]|uniref:Uncharacterized protein n=1 Tax=Photorhabdus asymbiotica subsp. asymbiotica (strain ATCC 43949 / 3105-77) TaxID=553480 RepID=C7BHU7_PHOAA|nr:hypothetical protein PAU_01952 [Photorhabdus asymbiotica]
MCIAWLLNIKMKNRYLSGWYIPNRFRVAAWRQVNESPGA